MKSSDKDLSPKILEKLAALRSENRTLMSRIQRLESLVRAQNKASDDLLTISEAAALLNKAPKTIRNWRSAKKFPRPDTHTRNGRKQPLWFRATVLEFKRSLEG